MDIAATFLPVVLQIIGVRRQILKSIRLLRLFRFAFLLRQFEAFEDIYETLRMATPSLSGPLIGLAVAITGFASLIYTAEVGSYDQTTKLFMVRNEDCESSSPFVFGNIPTCPKYESRFFSILHTMWFVLISFLTVGYGDMAPKTFVGRVLSGAAIVLGVLFMAMPIAIVGAAFTMAVEQLRHERSSARDSLQMEQARNPVQEARIYKQICAAAPLPSITFFRYLRAVFAARHLGGQ